jgi:hypothetical protein
VRWIIVAALAATSIYALRELWADWRGRRESYLFRAPEWWPFDMPAWRALVRAGPVGAVDGILAAAKYGVSGLGESAARDVVDTALEVLIVVVLLLMVAVGLFNRPSALVAPALRRFPGAVDEWRGAAVPGPQT